MISNYWQRQWGEISKKPENLVLPFRKRVPGNVRNESCHAKIYKLSRVREYGSNAIIFNELNSEIAGWWITACVPGDVPQLLLCKVYVDACSKGLQQSVSITLI
jgi:hypothetical protein